MSILAHDPTYRYQDELEAMLASVKLTEKQLAAFKEMWIAIATTSNDFDIISLALGAKLKKARLAVYKGNHNREKNKGYFSLSALGEIYGLRLFHQDAEYLGIVEEKTARVERELEAARLSEEREQRYNDDVVRYGIGVAQFATCGWQLDNIAFACRLMDEAGIEPIEDNTKRRINFRVNSELRQGTAVVFCFPVFENDGVTVRHYRDSISIYRKFLSWNEGLIGYELNWSAWGNTSVEDSQAFAESMMMALKFIEILTRIELEGN